MEQEKPEKQETVKLNNDLEIKLRESEEARIRAEVERDALRTLSHPKDESKEEKKQWTQEQWDAWTASSQLTKEQTSAAAGIAREMVEGVKKEFEKRYEELEKKSEHSKSEAESLKKKMEFTEAKSKFYENNPALTRYDKEFTEFLESFPEADRADTKKLPKLMEMAATFVKGKVGEKMKSFTPKFEKSDKVEVEEETINESEFDTSELRTIRDIQQKNSVGKFKDLPKSKKYPGVGLSLKSDFIKAYKDSRNLAPEKR